MLIGIKVLIRSGGIITKYSFHNLIQDTHQPTCLKPTSFHHSYTLDLLLESKVEPLHDNLLNRSFPLQEGKDISE